MSDGYTRPLGGWTCFHCGETFRTPGSAGDHFGADPTKEPGCMLRVQVGEERGLLMELRKAEAEIQRLRRTNSPTISTKSSSDASAEMFDPTKAEPFSARSVGEKHGAE